MIHILGSILDQGIQLGKNPLIYRLQDRICNLKSFLRHVHHDETGCVPDLVCKVSARLYSFIVETHVITRCITGDQGKTQGICTILIDNLQRIDPIAKTLTHLTSLRISDKSMEQNCLKRSFSHLLIAGEDHPDNPEEDNIIAGYQYICRVKIFQILCLLRPAKCGERPEC